MLASQLLIDGSPQQASDFVAELLDLSERRILRGTVRSVTHGCHRCHALSQLFLRLSIQNNALLNFHAHASFSSSSAK